MKLLIIAGPYEADRIRRAAVVAGFEAVAIEPGESLSGWITATRPDVIILAPQIVSADPAVALAKVRAVPRGRVPIFLVGEAHEQELLQTLGDGFFVRPVAPDELLTRAREAVARVSAAGAEESGSGPKSTAAAGVEEAAAASRVAPGSGPHLAADRDTTSRSSGSTTPSGAPSPELQAGQAGAASGGRERAPTLRPLVPAGPSGISAAAALTRTPLADPPLGVAVPRPGKTSERWPPPRPGRDGGTTAPRPSALPASLLDTLAETIDADFDAELHAVVRAMATGRSGPAAPSGRGGGPPTAPGQEAVGESSRGDSPKAPPSSAPPDGVTAEAVQARHALVREGDYFQILGVPVDAGAAQIASACQDLLAKLSADAVPRAVAARCANELAELRTVVAEAGRLLADESLRRQYRAHLFGSGRPRSESESPTP